MRCGGVSPLEKGSEQGAVLVYSSVACFIRKKTGALERRKLAAITCSALQARKRQNMPVGSVGNSLIKIILYGIGSKML